MKDKYEKMARFYIEGNAGLFDLYKYEMASPLCYPPEVEGARWILLCLTNPANRRDLEAIIEQADLRMKTEAVKQKSSLIRRHKG